MKKVFKILILTCIYILTLQNASFAGFSDINGHWCEEKINNFLESGFIQGYEDGSFKPDKSITRVELCKIINSYMNYEVSGEWQTSNMEIAKEKGYLTVGEVSSTITREEAFVVFTRLMGLEMIETSLEYVDADEISIWAVPAVKSLTFTNYLKGYPTNELKPKKDITRAEVITILYEYVGIGGLDETLDNLEFEVGYLKHNKYGLEFVKIENALEIKVDEVVTLAVTLKDDEDVFFDVIEGEEFIEFDDENLIVEGIKNGDVRLKVYTDRSNKQIDVIINVR